jgi:hypothetical protein
MTALELTEELLPGDRCESDVCWGERGNICDLHVKKREVLAASTHAPTMGSRDVTRDVVAEVEAGIASGALVADYYPELIARIRELEAGGSWERAKLAERNLAASEARVRELEAERDRAESLRLADVDTLLEVGDILDLGKYPESIVECAKRARSERDDAIARAEQAEHERDKARGESRFLARDNYATNQANEEIRARLADAEAMVRDWSDWGDAAVALVEPLDDGAVWGTPEVRKFIGEAVAKLPETQAQAAAMREALEFSNQYWASDDATTPEQVVDKAKAALALDAGRALLADLDTWEKRAKAAEELLRDADAHIEEWQSASGLLVGGDPGGVMPRHLAAEMKRHSDLFRDALECISLFAPNTARVAELRDRLAEILDG